MKWIKWIVLAVVLVVIGGVLIVWLNLNGIVRRTVQTQATASLNLQTTVGGARVSLFGGSVGLNDVQVASPQGFQSPRMFTLEGTSVRASWGQLRQDPVRVNQIVIDQPRLVVEQQGGQFNFQVLMDQPSQAPPDEETLRLIIDELTVREAHVVLRPGIPGLASEIVVPIPSFTVNNIGTGEGAENGAAVKEVVMLLVTTMAGKAAEAEGLPPEVQMLLRGNVAEVAREMATRYGQQAMQELQKNLPPEVGGVVGGILDAKQRGEDPGKAVEEGLRGLLDRTGRRQPPATQPNQ